jgi:hypothetical protein
VLSFDGRGSWSWEKISAWYICVVQKKNFFLLFSFYKDWIILSKT